MKTRPIPRWPWLLLLAGLLLCVSPVTAQESPLSTQPQLTPDVRARLSEAAQNHTLAPWQREFMLHVARGATGTGAADRPLALPGTAQPPAGITADDGTWIEVRTPHSARTAIYDPVRDRMLVFGGLFDAPSNDVWALSLAGSPAWSALAPAGTPPSPRVGHTAIYDPVRDRMLVFGGAGGGPLNDVWALSLAGGPAWSALAPVGTPPSPRGFHTAIYDPVRDRMLVFGGYSASSFNDVWALSLAGSPNWRALGPFAPRPSPRYGHTAIYDPLRDRMVVFGGLAGGTGGNTVNDVWALSLADSPGWSALAPVGIPPSPRYGHTVIYDPVRDRMLVFGGIRLSGTLNDAWSLSMAGSPTWGMLAPSGTPPSPRSEHAAIYDPVRDRMLVFGGYAAPAPLNDVRALSLASPAWSALIDAGFPPYAREGHTAIYDPVRDRMLVFGGVYFEDPDTPFYFNDVWALSLAGPTWSLLAPVGTSPSPRAWHTAIYDPVRDRMLVFGGYGAPNDVWALSLADSPAWSMLAPAGIPPSPRSAHSAIYDPVRDRMLIFGGGAGDDRFNDVWALSLAGSPAWSALAPAGIPPSPRLGHSAVYDPVRDRMLVFGGYAGSVLLDDVWALSLAGSPAWSTVAAAGTPPSTRYAHTAIYDAVRDRMLVFGGYDGAAGTLNDAWSLSMAGSPAWSALAPAGSPPAARMWHTAIYDAVRDRMLVFGGLESPGDVHVDRNDLWALEWETPVSVPESGPANRFALAPPRPNPSFGRATLDFTVPQAAHVSVVIYDVAGRVVRKLVDDPLPAGQHSTVWDCRDQSGRAVPTGLYLVRVASPGVHLVSKVIVQGVSR